MDRPELVAIYTDGEMPMPEKLKRLFFPATPAGTAAAQAFLERLASRTGEPDLPASTEVAPAQLGAMIAWANWEGDVTGGSARFRIPCS